MLSIILIWLLEVLAQLRLLYCQEQCQINIFEDMKKTLIHNCIVYFIQTVSSQTPGDYYVPFSLPGDETFDQWYQPPDNKSNKKENISQGSLSSPLSANLIQTSFDPSCIPLGYLNRQQNNCCFVDVSLLVMLSRKTPPLHVSWVCVRMFSPWPKLQVTYLFTSSYVTPQLAQHRAVMQGWPWKLTLNSDQLIKKAQNTSTIAKNEV